VDGAHNADSAEKLRGYIDKLGLSQGITFILGLSESEGKTVESVLRPLLREGDRVGCVTFSTPAGMPWVKPVDTEALAGKAKEIVRNGEVAVLGSLQDGLDWADKAKGLIVLCGSLYLVADYYRSRSDTELACRES
jgi:folylpolyglutamate synthase/dihydropteroate synthase